jgi:hypothetical protein
VEGISGHSFHFKQQAVLATSLRFAIAGCDISVTGVPGLNQPLIF